MNETLLGPARSECSPSIYAESEVEKKEISAADLVRYFMAGQLKGDDLIPNEVLQANISQEFGVSEGILVFGEKLSRSVWIAPEAADALQKRFGGVKEPATEPLDEELGSRGF